VMVFPNRFGDLGWADLLMLWAECPHGIVQWPPGLGSFMLGGASSDLTF
jgi:hypothetical protein